VREGLDETLTLQRLGIDGTLYRKLRSTNAIENLNSGIAAYSKNVKRWQGGKMAIRWVSAAILEAEQNFRRVQGWRDIKKLVTALKAIEQKQEPCVPTSRETPQHWKLVTRAGENMRHDEVQDRRPSAEP